LIRIGIARFTQHHSSGTTFEIRFPPGASFRKKPDQLV
jgi:hypothetical protein